jgi:hypothetical protein
MMMDRYKLKETLENGIATVTFEKVDGTLREMRCTLQADMLPKQLLREEGDASHRTTPDTVLAVWDLDQGGWRSFRVDSVKNVVLG